MDPRTLRESAEEFLDRSDDEGVLGSFRDGISEKIEKERDGPPFTRLWLTRKIFVSAVFAFTSPVIRAFPLRLVTARREMTSKPKARRFLHFEGISGRICVLKNETVSCRIRMTGEGECELQPHSTCPFCALTGENWGWEV